jgi:hypothetical protein
MCMDDFRRVTIAEVTREVLMRDHRLAEFVKSELARIEAERIAAEALAAVLEPDMAAFESVDLGVAS